jgi:ATPase subunit of ABC transporter with duplicated ATPase domains
MIDEPTNHLDLESITAFNNSLKNLKVLYLRLMIMNLLKQ